MLTMLFITLLAFGAYVCVHHYKRDLARKAGRWIVNSLQRGDIEKRNSR